MSTASWPDQAGCLFCGTRDQTLRYRLGAWSVVECPACGMWSTSPRPTLEELDAVYGRDYPPHQPSGPARHGTGWRRIWAVPPWPRGTRILEWGSATGRFKKWAEEHRGWSVTACDGVGAAEAWAGEPGAYDAVVAWQVLEHTLDPVVALARAHVALRAGGMVVLSVPNRASLERLLWGSRWKGWQVPAHLWHFDPGRLRGLVRSSGFTDVAIVHHRTFSGLRPQALRDCVGAVVAAMAWSGQMTVTAVRPCP